MELKKVVIRGKNYFSRYGLLGRKKQIEDCLSREKDAGFNIKRSEWEAIYQEIQSKYKEIRIHKLWSTRIGEYIARYLTVVEDSIRNTEKGILDVFVLSDCINHNSRLFRIMRRNIYIIDETNVDMWQYLLLRFSNVKFTKYWDDYGIRKNDRFRTSEYTVQYFSLSEEEKKEGHRKMEAMGLHGPFVCIASRDSTYLSTIHPTMDTSYHDYRDSDINQFDLSADYLADKGITVVRMGRYVKNAVKFKNCIDYANEYYDELLDIVLMKECKFYVGDAHGLCYLPMVLNRPVAFKNYIPVFLDSEAYPYNPYNLYIFKKYYKKNENRFLAVKEMMQIEKKVRYDGRRYAEYGIEVVENTAEEILDLVMEMNARIDGEWVETPEDIELQEKYQMIYKQWCMQEHYKESAVLNIKIGTMFLRKNPFLLD